MYFTIFTVEALIAASFLLLVSLFILSLRGRSAASFHIGMSFLIFSSISICYVVVSTTLAPVVAYNRWISAYTSIPAALHVFLVFFHYPTTVKPKWAKNVLYSGWALLLVGWVLFIGATVDAAKVFRFGGHNWTINAPDEQRLVALAIIIMVLAFTAAGIWRTIITKGKQRWVVLGILLSYLIVTVVPAIFNLRSREGYMDRGTFMIILNLATVLGLFTMAIIYINNTRERTSFMAKIIGVSLVTFLLVLEFVANITLDDRDNSYDQKQVRNSRLLLAQKDSPDKIQQSIKQYSQDFVYIRGYDLRKQKVFLPESFADVNKKRTELNFAAYHNEYRAAFFWQRLARLAEHKGDLSTSSLAKRIDSIFAEISHPAFLGHKNFIKSLLKQIPASSPDKIEALRDKLRSIDAKLLPFRIKFRKMLAGDFKAQARQIIAQMPQELSAYQKALSGFTAETVLEGRAYQRELLQYIAPFHAHTDRVYRKSDDQMTRYVAFLFWDQGKNAVYEIGFDYLGYRSYVNEAAQKFVWLLVVLIPFVIFGFRIFFYGALIRPLNSLLEGLKEVQKGRSDVHLEIFVEDEIGFITRSFNSMVRAIRAAELKLQRYAENLEDKVKARTAELSDTLQTVQSLKVQQDGDYFLTSLILKPLGPNRAQSDNIDVDFYVEQKKKFKFRKWESDIGGDICIADNIVLEGSRYVVFINGDAMGKSMQGAGGAMVLGAAFQSVLERSHGAADVQNQSPERWLKNAFNEMHAIFESFDGSMLMSAVLGLIEEKTGLLYFINAEHPYNVIYRNARAGFIEEGSLFRKLGSAILAGRITVQTFQLKHDDVLYLGSDGRDDLLLGYNEKEERIINEDETLFLRCVEQADGDLAGVVDCLRAQGEFTDDLSLMRIHYTNKEMLGKIDPLLASYVRQARIARKGRQTEKALDVLKRAQLKRKKHPLLFKELLKTFLAQKEYEEAIYYGREYCKQNPSDTQSLFAVSYAMKKSGRYEEAIDLGERVRLRDANFVNNLLNLAESYLLSGILERSEKIAQEAIDADPQNERAKILLRKIQNRQGQAE